MISEKGNFRAGGRFPAAKGEERRIGKGDARHAIFKCEFWGRNRSCESDSAWTGIVDAKKRGIGSCSRCVRKTLTSQTQRNAARTLFLSTSYDSQFSPSLSCFVSLDQLCCPRTTPLHADPFSETCIHDPLVIARSFPQQHPNRSLAAESRKAQQ